MKASRIADLEARVRGRERASRDATARAPSATARDADATTSYYAPTVGDDDEAFAGARATASAEAAARRAYAESYARRMLGDASTRDERGRGGRFASETERG